ncbi:hypothetical protein AGMMS49546_15560 [Spirochaetia bacterium]|nr:hypothetical protein AGMMS49546_15560 [Spirochaetia bacterium]
MGRYKTLIGISAAAILILGILAYTQLEIYQRTDPAPPSREVRVNPFYAMEKWLSKTGHPVRIDSRGSPSRLLLGKERSVYIQASLFDWQDGASILVPWVENGGSLLISLEPGWFGEAEEDFLSFLEAVGVRAELWVPPETEDDGMEDDRMEEDEFEPFVSRTAVTLSTVLLRDNKNSFNFDSRFCFSLIEDFDFDEAPFLMKDRQGIPRLVSVPLGQGALAVTGRPFFMYNDNLKSEENARLSWALTAAKAGAENGAEYPGEYPGVLFIRGRRAVKSLFGKLAERGNLLPPILSVLALVLIGFWMVIPGFGFLRSGEEGRARPIRDRFRAETRFLKKYHALDTYLEVYIREIKNKCRDRVREPGMDQVEEIERHLSKKKGPAYREIIRNLKILENMMERL